MVVIKHIFQFQIVNCLKLMTQKHKISVIVSIHQPNVEVLDIFDNLYVLSKGGVNVYSGPPHSLRQHLIDCHIDCKVDEIAIEKILKVCANNCEHSRLSICKMQQKMFKIPSWNKYHVRWLSIGSESPIGQFDFHYYHCGI